MGVVPGYGLAAAVALVADSSEFMLWSAADAADALLSAL